MKRAGLLAVSCVLACASQAAAQDERTVGLVMGFPATVGIHWQVSDRIAIRGDGSYTWSDVTVETNDDFISRSILPVVPPTFEVNARSETSVQQGSIGVSILWDLHRQDAFRLYLAPRVGLGITHASSTYEIVTTPVGLPRTIQDLDESETSYSPVFSVSLGASSRMGERFGVFGEAGFSYNRTTEDRSVTSTRQFFGMRAGVGAIVFF